MPLRPLILLADDHADARVLLKHLLDDVGADLEEADSGEQALALALAGAGRHALIVLDQRMPPGIDGIEVAERLRAHGCATPILLCSAFLDPDVRERAQRLGLRIADKGDPDAIVADVRELLGA